MNLNYKKLSGNQILKMMKNKSRLISVLMLLLLAILITIPAFFPNRLPLSWDGTLHMARFTQISDALRHGKLPPLIAFYGAGDNLNAFVGMYPWLADLIIVIPMTFISNKMIALLIGYFLLNIITGLNVYLLLSELTKSRVYRLLGTTLYLFNSYHIIDLYARVEWGEGVAYAFFPLVALGLLRIYKGKKYGIIFLSLGMIGLANSHLLSLLGAIILLVIIELYRMVTRKFSIKELKDFVLATVISLIASSYTFFQILLISRQIAINNLNKFNDAD